jgi:hypothetical protein
MLKVPQFNVGSLLADQVLNCDYPDIPTSKGWPERDRLATI